MIDGTTKQPAAELVGHLDDTLGELERAQPVDKTPHQNRLHELVLQSLAEPGGVEALARHAARLESAGAFEGSDWAQPEGLQPSFVGPAIRRSDAALAIEVLSALRFLAIATGEVSHERVTAQAARRFLEQVIALNLELLFPDPSEASRAEAGPQAEGVHRLFALIGEAIGTEGILAALVDEAERLLRQRPILVHRVKRLVRTAGRALSPEDVGESHQRTRRLVEAIEGPTARARNAGDLDEYAAVLADLDDDALRFEAEAFGSSLWVTGLASPHHAVLLRHLAAMRRDLLDDALGLGRTGKTSLEVHRPTVRSLIDAAVHPATAQCIYGLAAMLECGLLFFPPVGPALHRLAALPFHPRVADVLPHAADPRYPVPAPQAILVAGMLSVLGQPLGVGQGDNPTCQSARAISLWAQVDPAFLLALTAQAARDDDVIIHFEGQPIASKELGDGLVQQLHVELDAVSLVLVPHLDRVYAEMNRHVADRPSDGHEWINPELHGWWVHRGFATAIDLATGAVARFAEFLRLFHATYHPDHVGHSVQTHPQPAGIAATTTTGAHVGWHAITIQRVARDPRGEVRVYFYNPNNDSGQDWGQGVVVSTDGNGELFGEASLSFEQFASRLYLFHYNEREHGDPAAVPAEPIARIEHHVRASWGAARSWT